MRARDFTIERRAATGRPKSTAVPPAGAFCPAAWQNELERRAEERRPIRRLVELCLDDAGRFRHLFSKDLCSGGIFVYTDKPVAEGNKVELILRTPDRRTELRLEGRVARCVRQSAASPLKRAGMAVEFTNLDEAKRAEIRRYLDEATPRPPALPTTHVRYEVPAKFEAAFRTQLSDGWLFVQSDRPLSIGNRVRVFLHAPQLPSCEVVEGVVIGVVGPEGREGPGMHLRLDIDQEFAVRIERYLAAVRGFIAT